MPDRDATSLDRPPRADSLGGERGCSADIAGSASDVLRRHGLRPTRQRVAIYTALRGTTAHPTAEALHRQLDTPDHPIALATVYNVLDALISTGLCRCIPATEGNRWDASMHDHVHLRRPGAAEVLDVPDDLGDRVLASIPAELIREIEARMGVRIDGISVDLHAR